MSLPALRQRAERIWQSRWLTVAFVACFAAFVGRGFLWGREDHRSPELQLDVQFHLVRTTASSVTVRGRATIATVRESGMRAMLVGPSEIAIRSAVEPAAMLEIGLEWEETGPGDRLQWVDEASGVVYEVTDLQCRQMMFSVPLPNPNTRLRLLPSRPDLGYSLTHYRWVTNQPLQPFSAKPEWGSLRQDEVAKLELGCGWWPHQAAPASSGGQAAATAVWPAPADERWSRRYSCVRIEPARTGAHRLGLVFRRPDPKAPLPRLYLDGVCVFDGTNPALASSVTADGDLSVIEVALQLGAVSVLGIECPGPYRSRQETGSIADWHRIAYEIKFDRSWLRAVP